MKPRLPVRPVALVLALASPPSRPSARAPAAPAAPPTAAPPAFHGTPKAGETLTATPGTWATPPTSLTYAWQRCSDAGTACAPSAGRRGRPTCPPPPTSARPTASSRPRRTPAATTDAPSAVTAVIVSGAAPQNTAVPTVTGTPTEGQTLVGADGTWAGAATIAFTYAWSRCDATGGACVPITGATAKTYVLTAADVDKTLRLAVTAKNALGSATETTVPDRADRAARARQRRHAPLGRQVDRRDRRQAARAARDRQGLVLAQPAELAGGLHRQGPRLGYARLRGAQRDSSSCKASRSAAPPRRPRSKTGSDGTGS